MPLPAKVISELNEKFKYSTAQHVPIPGFWEPEKSHCFSDENGLLMFYEALAQMPNFHIIDPKRFHYNRMYVGLGVNSTMTDLRDLGYVLRNRFHYKMPDKENRLGTPYEGKVCLKSAGKELDRDEFELSVKSLRFEHNLRALGEEFSDIPETVLSIPASSFAVSSAAGVSRTGFHGFHIMPELDSIVYHAISTDVCQTTTPSVWTNVKRTQVVLCGRRNEGEYEANNAFTNDPSLQNEEGAEIIYTTSLNQISQYIENAGLPIVESNMNKIEAADADVARYYEEEHASADGRLTALSQGMKSKDYHRTFMRAGLDRVCVTLPKPGSVLPENARSLALVAA